MTTEKIDIAACIADLLYTRDTVILPGLGAFEGSYKAAYVDAVQGLVHPPGKKLQFNPNLKLDDGVLTHEIAQRYQWPADQARKELEAHIARLRQSLDKREIVEIPGVGRLYVDFEGAYKFLPAQQNFHAPSFGLPDVKFNPITRKPVQPLVREQVAAIPPRPASRQLWFQFNSPYVWIISLAALVLTVSIFFIIREISSNIVPSVVIKPPEAGAVVPGDDMEDDEPELDEDNAFVTGSLGELVDTEAPTRPPGVKEAVVIIGAFGDEANAARQIQKLFMDGYEAYSDQDGATTRVGIRLAYESDEDLQSQLKVIQSRYNKKAWVFFPDAE